MKFLNESYLLEQEINKREPITNGKIKVSSEEWEMLWNRQLGSTKKDVENKSINIHDWFNKIRQFGDKYTHES